MANRCELVREIRRDYRRFVTVGKQFTVRLNPSSDLNLNRIDHFLASINDLFEHVLDDVQDSDMVGVAIRNEVNHSNKHIGLSFRRRDQRSGDVLWSVFRKYRCQTRNSMLSTH
jgi:hypothetical protein